MIWEEGHPPDPQEYNQMRADCGLIPRGQRAAEVGLPRGLHVVTLRDGDRLIAMGRVIGDGGTAAQITDICVRDTHRRRGLATEVMRRLLRWCEARLPNTCFVTLIADPGAEGLYAKVGFLPTQGLSMGVRMGQITEAAG